VADALEAAVRAALARVLDPEIRRPITELDMVEAVEVSAGGAPSSSGPTP
jgi:ATP-binding protein involved in chromosome partitioning